MSELSIILDRWRRIALRRVANIRPRHLVAVLVVASVAAGLVGLRFLALPVHRPPPQGERMRIHVVAPTEPEITAGPVMEVGTLVNALESAPPKPDMVEPVGYAPYDDTFEVGRSRIVPKRTDEEAVIHAPPQPEMSEPGGRDERVGSWFGFDAPERDYRAEREARRARREVRAERERDRREVRRYHSDGDGGGESRIWSERPPPDRRD